MINTNVAKNRRTLIKIELLDIHERPIGSVEGNVISGGITIDGNSILRRVANLTFLTTDDNYQILETSNSISISKKIKIKIGEKDLDDYFSPVKWTSMGVFVLTGFSSVASTSAHQITISAKDKMALHNGDVAGKVKYGVRVDSEFVSPEILNLYSKAAEIFDFLTEEESGNSAEFEELNKTLKEIYNNVAGVNYEIESTIVRILNTMAVAKLLTGKDFRKKMKEMRPDFAMLSTHTGREKLSIREIVRYTATSLAGELPGKVIVSDIPEKIKTPVQMKDGSVGFRMIKYTYPEELTLTTGQPVTIIYERCKEALGGNYEYFYDAEGNFVFQEIKNYRHDNIVDINKISSEDYIVSHDRTPIQVDFSSSDIITSYSNTPNPENIKNDFHVWGNNSGAVIGYHLAIDKKPSVPRYVENRYLKEKDNIIKGSWKDFKIENLKENLIPNGWDSFEPYGSGKNYVENWNFESDNISEYVGGNAMTLRVENETLVGEVGDKGILQSSAVILLDKDLPLGEYMLRFSVKTNTDDIRVLYRPRVNNDDRKSEVFDLLKDNTNIVEFTFNRTILVEYDIYIYIRQNSNAIAVGDKMVIDWVQLTPIYNQHLVVEKTPLGNGLTRIQTWGGNHGVKLNFIKYNTQVPESTYTYSLYVEELKLRAYLSYNGGKWLEQGFNSETTTASTPTIVFQIRTGNINDNLDFIASDPQIVEGNKPNPTMIVEETKDGREKVSIYGAREDTKLVYKGDKSSVIPGEPYTISANIQNNGVELDMNTGMRNGDIRISKGYNKINHTGEYEKSDIEISLSRRK